MANTIFKGFRLITEDKVKGALNGYLYFVRTNDTKTDGYILFNGKKYGTAEDVATELNGKIGTLPSGFTNVVAYVESVHEALETLITDETNARISGDTALNARIDALSGTSHTHKNKEVLDGITAEKVTNWDAAEQNAKDYADAEIDKLDAKVSGSSNNIVVTVTEADGVLTDVLVEAPNFADLYDEKGAAASAETAAKNYADTKVGEEATARENADKDLDDKISGLTLDIAAEEAAREEADSALNARIDALSGTSHTHTNKEVLDGITAEKVANWDAAEKNAKDYASAYTDTEIAKLDAEVSGTSHDVTVTVTEVDGKLNDITVVAPDFAALYDEKGAAASAQTAAEAYADEKVTAEAALRESGDTTLGNRLDSLEVDKTVTGTSNAAVVTVSEADGVLSAATIEVKVDNDTDNALEIRDNGLFAAIYYEDLDV